MFHHPFNPDPSFVVDCSLCRFSSFVDVPTSIIHPLSCLLYHSLSCVPSLPPLLPTYVTIPVTNAGVGVLAAGVSHLRCSWYSRHHHRPYCSSYLLLVLKGCTANDFHSQELRLWRVDSWPYSHVRLPKGCAEFDQS